MLFITVCASWFPAALSEPITVCCINNCPRFTPSSRRQFHWLFFIFKCINLSYPEYLKQYLIPFSSSHSLRHATQVFFVVPWISKEIGRFSFQFKAPFDWNNLPSSIRSITSFHVFKNSLARHLQNVCYCFWLLLFS